QWVPVPHHGPAPFDGRLSRGVEITPFLKVFVTINLAARITFPKQVEAGRMPRRGLHHPRK
ncbi:MAG: hypothetical protein P8Y71_23595, partial [Pseudolabrys sp.]